MACYPVFKFDLQHLSTSGRLAHWRTVFLDGNRKSCGTRHRTAIHRSTSTYQMAQRHLCGQTKIGWYTHRKQTCRKQHSRLGEDRKSTRLNSSHVKISYAVFCLKKKRAQAGMEYQT